ncbi:MAG: hypothetical protein Q7S74_00930 [Nanoarchaeota archaeon]|nr:hypothetical protein [Nanoarchaeota archaeon]
MIPNFNHERRKQYNQLTFKDFEYFMEAGCSTVGSDWRIYAHLENFNDAVGILRLKRRNTDKPLKGRYIHSRVAPYLDLDRLNFPLMPYALKISVPSAEYSSLFNEKVPEWINQGYVIKSANLYTVKKRFPFGKKILRALDIRPWKVIADLELLSAVSQEITSYCESKNLSLFLR